MAEELPEQEIQFTRWLSEMRAGLAETVSGVLLRGARPVYAGQTAVSTALVRVISTSPGRLLGWSFRELTNASWSVIELWDVAALPGITAAQAEANGDLVATFTASPGLGTPHSPMTVGAGIAFQSGLVCVQTPQPNAQSRGVVYLGGPD